MTNQVRLVLLGAALLAMALPRASGRAQAPGDLLRELHPVASKSRNLPHVTSPAYAAELDRQQAAIDRCSVAASACDPNSAGEQVTVTRANAPAFDTSTEWLRTALKSASSARPEDRENLMQRATERIAGDRAELSHANDTGNKLPPARSHADAILSRTEFSAVTEATWWQQQLAALGMLLSLLFAGAAKHMPHAPWLTVALEWGLLAVAAAALLLWAWRTTRQSRIAALTPSGEGSAIWQKESDDWALRAQEEAARGAWRDAVHCLYWAAIVMLEGRRAWRANRARTPREYLPLLEAGSARQRSLAGLTRLFERIWYGLRPAGQQDFERAQTLLAELRAS